MIIDRGRIIAQGTPESSAPAAGWRAPCHGHAQAGPPDAPSAARLDGVVAVVADGAQRRRAQRRAGREPAVLLECAAGQRPARSDLPARGRARLGPARAVQSEGVARGHLRAADDATSGQDAEAVTVRCAPSSRGGLGVNGIRVTFGREFRAYFFSPLAYGVLTSFLFFNGIIFSTAIGFLNDAPSAGAPPRSSSSAAPLVSGWRSLFFVPILPMRLLAEERRSGTLELLMTSPVSETQVVLGKYLAAPRLLSGPVGADGALRADRPEHSELDWGPLPSAYLGIALHRRAVPVGRLLRLRRSRATRSSPRWSGFAMLFALFSSACSSSWSRPEPAAVRLLELWSTWTSSRRASSTPGAWSTTSRRWRSFSFCPPCAGGEEVR